MLAKLIRRSSWPIAGAFILSTLLVVLLITPHGLDNSYFHSPWATDTNDIGYDDPKPAPPSNRSVHLIMPATGPGVGFCKSLLSMAILGYPKPKVVGWGDADGDNKLLGGGSHFAKITRLLEFLNDEENRKKPGFDDDLVLMFDAYDIWFQLPLETLVSRYDAIIAEENERLVRRLGRAQSIENITSTIVFAGGKRCCPNWLNTIACYPIPESPLPLDLYGGNSDSTIGITQWSSHRTRYLVGGYALGPVRDMRPLLERAKDKMDACLNQLKDWTDISDRDATENCYRGSDQSLFAEIWGEQEFHREVMRRRHRKHYDNVLDAVIPHRPGAKPPSTHLDGFVYDDYLNPPFTHVEQDPGYVPGKPYEYGITVDYWSLLGHQTANAWMDRRFVRLGEPFDQQVGALNSYSCKPKQPIANDIPDGGVLDLMPSDDWYTLPLYSEICVGVVPVMIHHNCPTKTRLETEWNQTWWSGKARYLLEERRRQKLPTLVDTLVSTDKGENLGWAELCPAEYDEELFRGEPVPEYFDEDSPDDEEPPNDLSQEDSVQNPPQEDPPQENPPQENPPQENPPQENPPQENPPQENPPQENPPQENPPQENPPQENPPQENPPQDPPQENPPQNPPQENPPQENPPQENPPQDPPQENPPQNPPQENPPQENPPQENPPQDPPQENPPQNPPQENPPQENPPQENPPQENPPQENPPQENPPKEDAPTQDAPLQDISEQAPQDNSASEHTHDPVEIELPPPPENARNKQFEDNFVKDEPPRGDPPQENPPQGNPPGEESSGGGPANRV